MIDKKVIGDDKDIVKESMKDGFGIFAKHEAILRRSEEVKRDSIKLKLLEDILGKLNDIYLLLKGDDKCNCKDKNSDECECKEQEV